MTPPFTPEQEAEIDRRIAAAIGKVLVGAAERLEAALSRAPIPGELGGCASRSAETRA